jgi:hypothetical protein
VQTKKVNTRNKQKKRKKKKKKKEKKERKEEDNFFLQPSFPSLKLTWRAAKLV